MARLFYFQKRAEHIRTSVPGPHKPYPKEVNMFAFLFFLRAARYTSGGEDRPYLYVGLLRSEGLCSSLDVQERQCCDRVLALLLLMPEQEGRGTLPPPEP